MPRNTEASQAARRKSALRGASSATLTQLAMAALLWWLRRGLEPSGFGAKLMLAAAILELGTIIPIWIALKNRLNEIQGGEEDAAAQY